MPLLLVATAYGLGVALGAVRPTVAGATVGLALGATIIGLVLALTADRGSARAVLRRFGGTAVVGVALLSFALGEFNAEIVRLTGLGSLGRWVAAEAAGSAADKAGTTASATASATAPRPSELSRWVTITGTVQGEPEERGDSLQYLIRVATVTTGRGQAAVRGLVLARERSRAAEGGGGAPAGGEEIPPPLPGEAVVIEGDLSRPRPPGNPGEFDYPAYLRRRGVAAIVDVYQRGTAGPGRGGDEGPLGRLTRSCRKALGASLAAHLPPVDAALLQGIVFGGSQGLPPDLEKSFRDAGVFHILAVSGSNVAFVSGAVIWLTRRLWMRPQRGALCSIGAVWFYALMTGLGASVVRASIMATVVLAGRVLGRPASAANSLALSGLIILIIAPLSIGDSGFQLSFLATAGLLLAAADGGLSGERPGPVTTSLRATIGAQLALLPLTLRLFGQAPCLALVSNLAVIPLAGFLVVAGVVAAVAGLVVPAPLAGVVFLPCRLALRLMVTVVDLAGRLPAAYFYGPVPPWPLEGLYYAGLAWFYLARRRARPTRPGPTPRTRPGPLIPACSAAGSVGPLVPGFLVMNLAILLFLWPRLFSPSHLVVTFLDVGQGDCAVIRLPGGRCILVDAGGRSDPGGPTAAVDGASGRPPPFDPGERTVLPYLRRTGVWRIDLLVITHAHDDHAGGAAALIDGLPMDGLAEGTAPPGGTVFTCEGLGRAGAAAAARHVPIVDLAAGRTIRPARGVVLSVLAPGPTPLAGTHSDVNNSSVVLRLDYGQVTFLMAGDLESEGEEALLGRNPGLGVGPEAQAGRLTVLKVAHHGSQFSTTPEWLTAVSPAYAVISVGQNSFGHPSPATEERLTAAGAKVFRTDRDGAVTFTTDGRTLTVRAFRTAPEATGR